MAIIILAIKGSGGGQTTLFHVFAKKGIEETSASLSLNKASTGVHLADISNLAAYDTTPTTGQGGQGTKIEPTTIQNNAIFANNPTTTDYIETESGQRINVVEYTVQPGDNLSFIARDYGVNIESIMWANGLTDSESIREGHILKIPPVSGVIHVVKNGDTVSGIAQKYGVESDNIIAYNALPLDGALQINDELIIPDGRISGSSRVVVYTPTFSHLPNLDDYFGHPTGGIGRISQWLHGRNGIDIANSYGTAIYAAANGTVVAARSSGWNGGFGLYVKISHPNGTDTLYAHISKVLVADGQTVQKGQKIGQMGSSGRSTGSHLHFEVHGAKNPLLK